MRATYVNGPELLTPFGEWLAGRVPHVESRKNPWCRSGERVFRIYAGRPYFRRCLFDLTITNFHPGRRRSWRVTILGRTIQWSMR